MKASRKKKTKKKAKKIQQYKSKHIGFPSDEESVVLRRKNAEKEGAKVKRLDSNNEFFGCFEVSSVQWELPYLVEIRNLTERMNSCSCQDYKMNRLGTCKHIERVLQYVGKRRKRRFAEAANTGSNNYELFMDTRFNPPKPRLLTPLKRSAVIDAALSPLFDENGIGIGESPVTWTAVERAAAKLSRRLRARIRISRHAEYWLNRERFRLEMKALRKSFERDVAKGKRSGNPVLLPLYPYQQQGMMHLAFTGRALLADEMGLGKTVQAIAAAEILRQLGKVRRVLVVCPASLKAEWEDQLIQFMGIKGKSVFGSRAARLRAYTEEHAFFICNYEQIRSDVDDINRLLVPDLIILDEAQRIKNWPTKTAKTIKRLQSPFAFVLTGTPLENRIEELYSLVEFIDPHVFGSLFRFQREYMEYLEGNEVRLKNLDRLHRIASTVMLRRRKKDVEDALPARTDKNFLVGMTGEQRKRYDEFEYEVAKLVAIMKRRPLTQSEHERLQLLLGCMRMTCDTPYILDQTCRDCPKLEELENILDDILSEPDVKALIFSEWVRMLDLIKELLDAKQIGYAEHTGKIPQRQRREQIKRFKENPDCRIFLSSESGGTGLNLQTANVVINIDLPWNPAKLEQRIARAWRKHQQRSVRVINLVSTNTIENKMIHKLAYKTTLANSVLDGAKFEERPKGASGREAFATRVSELLGGETPQEEPSVEKRSTPRLKEELIARYADAVIGIERNTRTRASIIVVHPGVDTEGIRRAVSGATEDAAEILTPDLRDLLLRLQEKGLLILPLRSQTKQTPKLHYEAARKVWAATESERKAAETLAGIGLAEQALPHLLSTIEKGREAIYLLHTGIVAAPTQQEQIDLQGEASVLMKDIDAFSNNKNSTPDLRVGQGLEIINQITHAIQPS